ncbi:MAG: DUF1653 domain-containing protein [Eubacterium sp.]|jgi:hypothetical protein|nr:DUF1653 domain-containing protein [Eubacterium sp.]
MTLFSLYDQKLIRLTDDQGNTFSGVADVLPAEYCLHEYGREEEAISLGDFLIYRSQIKKVDILPTYEEAMAAIPLGRYRHFKGNEYEVIALAKHSETEETMVIYKALYGDGGIWCRPADMWNETVTRDGKTYRRFYRLDLIKRVEKYERLFDEAVSSRGPEKLRLLEAYYTTGQWREDYEADERGELPPDLKRGVLSQDGLYNLLEGSK